VAIDERHVALPKLYGAPAYARPTIAVDESPRPFDPDDLPIEAAQTGEDRDLAGLSGESHASGGDQAAKQPAKAGKGRLSLRPRPLSLKALAGRVLRNDGS
jgi:hypothetical protein